ncbi:MAG: DUF4214 domain-containing protein [Acidimicrobiales bacterium]
MKRFATGFLAALFLLPVSAAAADDSAVGLTGETPVGAAVSDYASACPEMMDSIYRLYTAYFLREPDQVGWDYWFDTYGSGPNTNLEVVSEAFAASDEFRNTYGSLSNAEFVTLIYNNVMGRAPDTAGFNHWKGALDNGYLRGSVMIAFSESAEYVGRTGTTRPMAGDLVWYDRGLTLYCEVLEGGGLEIPIPTDITTPYFDILLENGAGTAINASFAVYDGNIRKYLEEVTIEPGFYNYFWNIPLEPGEDTIVVQANGLYAYTIVFYDTPHSENRVGWE